MQSHLHCSYDNHRDGEKNVFFLGSNYSRKREHTYNAKLCMAIVLERSRKWMNREIVACFLGTD